MTFKLNIDDPKRNVARLRLTVPAAVNRALNRGGVAAKTQLARDIAQATKLKVGDVKRRLRVTDATAQHPTVVLDASQIPVPLTEVGARGPYPSRGRGAGITTRGGRYPHAFFALDRKGRKRVFERQGRSRLPVRQIFGPNIADVAQRHAAAALARGQDVVLQRLQHEFARLLGSR